MEDEPSSQNANKKSGEAIIDNAQMASDSDSVKQPRSSPLADLDEPEKLGRRQRWSNASR